LDFNNGFLVNWGAVSGVTQLNYLINYPCSFASTKYGMSCCLCEGDAYTATSTTPKMDSLMNVTGTPNRRSRTSFYYNRIASGTHLYIAVGY